MIVNAVFRMIVAMAALICSAPLSVLRYTDEWEFCRWIIPLVVLLYLCKLIFGDDRGEIRLIQPLVTLFFCWISFSMKNNQAEMPVEYPKKQSKGIKDSSVQSTPPKRRTRRDKKKKKGKTMDEETEGSSKSDTCKRYEKTKVYAPLQQFLSLNMEMPELHSYLKRFVLTNEQLTQYDFPRYSPDHPGHIAKSDSSGYTSLRHCARCGAEFHISEKAKYSAESTCSYHPKRRALYRGVPGLGNYLCCNGDSQTLGCQACQFHVSAERFVDGASFCRVREKRQVRKGQYCAVYSLDCEMSYTTAGLEVTKIGVVGADGLTVYETFVLPEHDVLDYNTEYSGVTANDLKGINTTISDVQAFLLRLLNKDSILIGHALENDLRALRLIHEKIVDTSVVFPHMYGGRRRRSLRSLAEEYLQKQIQNGINGHDCIEDARTCMDLMLCKVNSIMKDRLPAIQDENKNSFLQNYAKPQQPVQPWTDQRYMEPLYVNQNGTYCFIPHMPAGNWGGAWLETSNNTCYG